VTGSRARPQGPGTGAAARRRSDGPRPLPSVPESREWKWLSHPVISLALVVIWLLLVNSVHPRMILLGLLLGFAIPLFTQIFLPDPPHVRSWRTLVRFVPLFLWDVVVANLSVARLILSFRRRMRPTWIVVPLDLENPYAISVLASVISLTPGTVSAQMSPDRRALLVHVLDTADPEAEVARLKTRYERPLEEIF
jgi:multicomponent K+:H+ antiporter subunit E